MLLRKIHINQENEKILKTIVIYINLKNYRAQYFGKKKKKTSSAMSVLGNYVYSFQR